MNHTVQQLLVSLSNVFDLNSVPYADMHIYGHCPAHDEVYLVVCNHCGQVVKPQAFEAHCQRWHGPLTNMCSQSSTVAPQQRPHPGRPPSTPSSSRERQKNSKCHEASTSSSATPPVYQQKPTKAHQEATRYCSRVYISYQHRKIMRDELILFSSCFVTTLFMALKPTYINKSVLILRVKSTGL